jgi:cell division protein FtsL
MTQSAKSNVFSWVKSYGSIVVTIIGAAISLYASLASLKTDVTNLNKEITDFKTDIRGLQVEIGNVRDRVSALEGMSAVKSEKNQLPGRPGVYNKE